MINQKLKEFESFFPKALIKKINGIVLIDKPIDHKKIILELYDEIRDMNYSPSKCVGYLMINKQNNVPRIIPVLSAKDYFLYYFCIKILEKELTEGRVKGTYGGWSMGNLIRKMEDQESLLLQSYGSLDSLNPYKWAKYWKQFQKKAYDFAQVSNKKCIVKFDIANFYNNINLKKLKEKIILRISNNKKPVLDLLFFFLENWDKKFSGYFPRNVGIPMDKIGDCSRILANFYLQEYDLNMRNLCEKYNTEYLRYADDILIYCKNQRIAKKILFESSKFLLKLDLDINTGKVVFFNSKKEFNNYWAFEFFDIIGDGKDIKKLELALKKMFRYKEEKIIFRENSVIKRILNSNFGGLDKRYLNRFIKYVLQESFFENLDYRQIAFIFNQLSPVQQQRMIKKIYSVIRKTNFNSCLYNLRKFLKMNAIDFNFEYINKKIELTLR